MKKLKLFSALFMCLFVLSQPVHCSDEIKYFVLWHDDGSSTALALEEHPLIKGDAANKQLICSTDTREITLNFYDVKRYSFEETADITSVNATIASAGSLSKCGESLTLINFTADTPVFVYTTDGILKEKHLINGDGNLTIHTQSWAQGLYIIKTEKTTYKILIK